MIENFQQSGNPLNELVKIRLNRADTKIVA